MENYLTIFREVRSLLEQEGYSNDTISSNYEEIFKNLSPNELTFQQLMVEYLSEFNVKSMDYIDQHYWTNGIRVRRYNDALIVTDVIDDLQFVVGDEIVALSGDPLSDLAERYQKLLFNEPAERQDWHPILRKQSSAKVRRSDQYYDFDLHVYDDNRGLDVIQHDQYTEVVVYSIDMLQRYLHEPAERLLIDLTAAYGVIPDNQIDWMAEQLARTEFVMLVDAMTKGSAERLADSFAGRGRLVGRETYGQAQLLKKVALGNHFFIYSAYKDKTVLPDVMVELSESSFLQDDIRQVGRFELMNRLSNQ
ncbi:hypothetical protein [Macrococcus equipercicus]|uniref:Uncharacterized protein n=1 Tax=Macrococcus equipercicus TaxID=69967 RepID=A0A9Q9BNZ7_9STAP|nr:hypothetical protein [Macrococcus equipercicus]UTH14615.1 hypothetical protein KFV11_04460 [Macrococcus equipercicus]